jgi:hypothetical protein
MKRKSVSQLAFLNPRILIGLFIALAGVFLALAGLGAFSALAQVRQQRIITDSKDPLVPTGFDCSKIYELGIDKQVNLRAGAIMIFCGEAQGGSASPAGTYSRFLQKLLQPVGYGTTDVDLITGSETFPNVTQSTTFTASNPDNPNQIVVTYNDSRGRNFNPIDISGASVSTDGGLTFTRLTAANGQSPFLNTAGGPVVLYNRPTGTWYTVWLDMACGGGGLGGYKSTTPWDPSPASWTHYCVHSNAQLDDRQSGWADNNPSSPFYGRMYVAWNDYGRNINIFVRYSTDNGNTWTNERQVANGITNGTFNLNVQITGDLVTGDVYIAGMNDGGGALTTRSNLFFRSTDGGNTWTNTYTGLPFNAPGRITCGDAYFGCMYANGGGYWRQMGSGEPAAYNHVVHYVYAARNASNGDPGDVFYIRSTDSGVTFSAPFQLNSNTDPMKAQWEPNLSVSPSGTVFAVWYDERDGGGASTCIPGTNSPCYRIWARKSTDNGLTWLPDSAFSEVVSPLPAQPDTGIVPDYAGDYDYGSAVLNQHLVAWVDGRVTINGISQQDVFFNRELTPRVTPTPRARPTPHSRP